MGAPSLLLWALLPATQAANVEKEIEDKVIVFNRAYERNELEEYFSHYADDLTLWFESGRVSLPEYKKSWYQLIENGGGVEKNQVSDLRVQVGPSQDTAIATYVVDVVTRGADGTRTSERAWETDIWFKREGQWKIVHLHYNSREAP